MHVPFVEDDFYLSRYPDVASCGVSPSVHYSERGWLEGFDPNPWFSTNCYLADNPDVRESGLNPLYHYLMYGKSEGRDVCPAAVDEAFYREVAEGLEPGSTAVSRHYHDFGWRNGLDPAPWFSTDAYLRAYPDVRAAGIDPFAHYLQSGRFEGRHPMPPGRSLFFHPGDFIQAWRCAARIRVRRWAWRFANRHAVFIASLAFAIFHLLTKWSGYPRTLSDDLRAVRAHFSNPVLCRQDRPIFSTLLQLADPTSVPWDQVHDTALLALPGADHLCLRTRIATPRAFLIILTGALMKRIGDLASARSYYQKLGKDDRWSVECLIGLADIHSLMAGWRSQLEEYIARGVYPRSPIFPASPVEPDLMSELETFRQETALEFYLQAHHSQPRNAFIIYQIARTLGLMNRWAEALDWHTKAFLSYPTNSLYELQMYYARAFIGDEPSIDRIRQCLSSNEDLLWEFGNIKVVSIVPFETIALDREVLLEAETLEGEQTVLFRGSAKKHRFVIEFPTLSFGKLRDARDIGWGTKLAEERFLVLESRHLSAPELKPFCRSVMIHNDRHALIGTRLEEVRIKTDNGLTVPGAAFNYYHWLIDGLSALLHLAKARNIFKTRIFFNTNFAFQRDSLRLCFGEDLALEPLAEPWPRFLFSELLHLPYPARYNVPHPASVRALRDRMSRAVAVSKGKRYYITRRAISGRKTLNEESIIRMLEAKGFTTYDPAGRSIEEQIIDFSDVEVVVAPAGAALTNLIFCPKETRVVIIESIFHRFETFSAMTAALGLRCWAAGGKGVTKPNPFFVWSIFDMTVDQETVASAVDRALESLD